MSVQRLLDAEEDSSEASEEAVNGDRMELTEDQVELTDNSNNLNKVTHYYLILISSIVRTLQKRWIQINEN